MALMIVLIVAQMPEGDQGARRIICIGHTAREIRPGPASGRGVGERMDGRVLLIEKPGLDLGPFILGQVIAQGLDRQRGAPGGKIGINGPAAIGAHRAMKELDGPGHTGVIFFT